MKNTFLPARWVSAIALAIASGTAAAAPLWVDNESFGFESCAALAKVPAAEDAQSVLAALRGSAESDLRRAGDVSGLAAEPGQQIIVTPVAGSFACGAHPSELTLRVAVVDAAGGYRSTEFVVVGEEPATPQTSIVALANQLSLTLRGAGARATPR